MRSPNEVFFSSGPVLELIIALFFDQLTSLRIILFNFCFLTEGFGFIFNYFESDIFLPLDRTLALDILHGSGKFTIISDNFKDLYAKVYFNLYKSEKFLDDAMR